MNQQVIMTPQLAEVIVKFLNRVDIKGHESDLLSQCKGAVLQMAQDAQQQGSGDKKPAPRPKPKPENGD